MARSETFCLFFVIVIGTFEISGCCSNCNARPHITSPVVPREIRDTRYVYSDMPAIVPFSLFREQLHQLVCQLTVVYLIYSDDAYDINMLRCLTDIQRRFFRYGVRVLVIDLHSEIHWPELKKQLYKTRANYIAEYLDEKGKKSLEDFLHFSKDVNRIFVIDSMANSRICRIYDKRCWRIIRKIKSILRNRAKNVSN